MVVAAIIFSIGLMDYTTWTVLQGDNLRGLQGRYFTPVLPILLLALGACLPISERKISLAVRSIVSVLLILILLRNGWLMLIYNYIL